MKEHAKKCAYNFSPHHGDKRNQFPDERGMCDCDGYHTFSELYDHRITLWITLCRQMGTCDTGQPWSWRSKIHSDGSSFDGWFVLGLGKESGKQISYHLPLSRWDETNFAETLERAPEFDGHTSADVLERIKKL